MIFDHRYTYYGIINNIMANLDIISMGSLKIRNFRHGNKRSSLKLEAALWDALHEIILKLELTENRLLSALADYKEKNNYDHGDGTFTSLVRVFIVNCMRMRATKFAGFRDMSDKDLYVFLNIVFKGHSDGSAGQTATG